MLKLIVCLDELSTETRTILTEWSATQKIQLKELHESKFCPCVEDLTNNLSVEAYGKEHLIEPIRATPERLASICYTSVSMFCITACVGINICIFDY